MKNQFFQIPYFLNEETEFQFVSELLAQDQTVRSGHVKVLGWWAYP